MSTRPTDQLARRSRGRTSSRSSASGDEHLEPWTLGEPTAVEVLLHRVAGCRAAPACRSHRFLAIDLCRSRRRCEAGGISIWRADLVGSRRCIVSVARGRSRSAPPRSTATRDRRRERQPPYRSAQSAAARSHLGESTLNIDGSRAESQVAESVLDRLVDAAVDSAEDSPARPADRPDRLHSGRSGSMNSRRLLGQRRGHRGDLVRRAEQLTAEGASSSARPVGGRLSADASLTSRLAERIASGERDATSAASSRAAARGSSAIRVTRPSSSASAASTVRAAEGELAWRRRSPTRSGSVCGQAHVGDEPVVNLHHAEPGVGRGDRGRRRRVRSAGRRRARRRRSQVGSRRGIRRDRRLAGRSRRGRRRRRRGSERVGSKLGPSRCRSRSGLELVERPSRRIAVEVRARSARRRCSSASS